MGNAVGNSIGNAVGNLAEILQEMLREMAWGMIQFFLLNMWLRRIYCLQTIHEPACVILTLFNSYFILTEQVEKVLLFAAG